MLKALIFDVDGTLANTERRGHLVAYNQAFKDSGLAWSWDEGLYVELLKVTGGKERIRYFIENYLPKAQVPSVACLNDLINTLHAIKTRHFVSIIESGAITARPGVTRILKAAHDEGMRMAIATSTSFDAVFAVLDHVISPGAESWFELIAAGDAVDKKKPAPDIYLYILEQLGLSGDECIAFEDSEIGLRSALAARIPTIVSVSDFTPDESFSGAALVVEHLGEPDLPMPVLSRNLLAKKISYLDMDSVRYLHAEINKKIMTDK